MPPTPELGYITREVRHTEVLHQADAEQPCTADSDIRVTGKVAVDLDSKEKSPSRRVLPERLSWCSNIALT
jgi:hypothetical protein